VIVQKPARGARLWLGSGYFALIGFGFMLLELSWIQRSILFLGQALLNRPVSSARRC
jgi:hypothetical protein